MHYSTLKKIPAVTLAVSLLVGGVFFVGEAVLTENPAPVMSHALTVFHYENPFVVESQEPRSHPSQKAGTMWLQPGPATGFLGLTMAVLAGVVAGFTFPKQRVVRSTRHRFAKRVIRGLIPVREIPRTVSKKAEPVFQQDISERMVLRNSTPARQCQRRFQRFVLSNRRENQLQ